MKLLSIKEMLEKATKERYAVGGFNVFNLETVQAVLAAAEEERAPVILLAAEKDAEFMGIPFMYIIAKMAAERATIPVALHLDHGSSFQSVIKYLSYGFPSVMIDGSSLPFEENVKLTKKVVEVTHAVDVPVEGELGEVARPKEGLIGEVREDLYTDPALVPEFVKSTGVDALAVAIGTVHGLYKREPKLDFDRLAKIRELVELPLVLHGGTGTPEEALKRAITLGISKINIGTDLRLAFVNTIEVLNRAHRNKMHPREMLKAAREAVKEQVKKWIRIFGSSGKA